MTTMVFVVLGEKFPEQRVQLSRIAGVVDRAMVTLGTVLSIPLVSLVARDDAAHTCFGSRRSCSLFVCQPTVSIRS